MTGWPGLNNLYPVICESCKENAAWSTTRGLVVICFECAGKQLLAAMAKMRAEINQEDPS